MLLWILMYKCLCGYMFSNLLGLYLKVEFLSPLAMLTFWETDKPLFKLSAPFYIPTSNLWVFHILYILTHLLLTIFIIMAISVGKKWYLQIMFFISIFLMVMMLDIFSELIGHLYIILREHLFRFFHIFNWVICFLLLNYKMSLYILDTFPLSDIWFSNLVPFLACLFTYIKVSWQAQKLWFWWSPTYLFLLSFLVLF